MGVKYVVERYTNFYLICSLVLNEREREIVVHRLKEDAGPSTETHFSWKQFRAAFTDWRVYMHSLIYICGSTPLYSLSLFLPSIISEMGFTNLTAQAMSAPPYAIGVDFFSILKLFNSFTNHARIYSLCCHRLGRY